MNINPIDHAHPIERLPADPKIDKGSGKIAAGEPKAASIFTESSTSEVQSLKKITATASSDRLTKIEEAKKLLESGAINDRKILRATAERMIRHDPLSWE